MRNHDALAFARLLFFSTCLVGVYTHQLSFKRSFYWFRVKMTSLYVCVALVCAAEVRSESPGSSCKETGFMTT
ncbi:hypothetical protein B0H13DRAFT_2000772 [Mycena leptocephala]|nr:hypothetical protein B0H13DRAFT_2000772 [Mycena leptocephala]